LNIASIHDHNSDQIIDQPRTLLPIIAITLATVPFQDQKHITLFLNVMQHEEEKLKQLASWRREMQMLMPPSL